MSDDRITRVSVRVLDREYQVACPAEERSDLLDSAEYLDAKMREVRDTGKVVGLDRIAVISALNIANELIKMRHEMALQNVLQLGVGFVISFIVALITVKVFVSFLQRGKLTPFAWYRILVAPIFYFLTRGLKF